MMRRISTILIAIFSITTIYAQETDVEKEGFKGKVKSVTQVNYDYVDNSKGEEYERYIIKYDSDGNKIEEVKYKGEILIPVSFTEWIFEYYD